MNYKKRLEEITTVKQLFDFMDDLAADAKEQGNLWRLERTPARSKHLDACGEANFYKSRVTAQIIHLESQGVFLNNIEVPE